MGIEEINYDKYINVFNALANEERIDILKLLAKKKTSPKEIEQKFFMGQSTASYHLNLLKKAGILKLKKEGKNSIYSVDQEYLNTILTDFSSEIF